MEDLNTLNSGREVKNLIYAQVDLAMSGTALMKMDSLVWYVKRL